MSSKAAAGRAMNEALIALLRYLTDGNTHSIGDREKLYYLKRYGYIQKRNAAYTLTLKGQTALSQNEIWNLKIQPDISKWDQKWRMVLFDIPISKRKRRDAFRRRLKKLGLTLYQNSVWVYPFPVEKEVSAIAHYYRLDRCISFATAEKISGDVHLRKKYTLGNHN